MNIKIAAIDIGSNTILMQIAEYNETTDTVTIIAEHHGIARLSENLAQTKFISNSAIQRAEKILKDYYEACKKQCVDKIIAVGTSAMREAKNAIEVKQRLELAFENICEIQIISGEKESLLSFQGATNEINDIHKQCVVLDIGGGSTELIIGNKAKIAYNVSIPIGVVKLTEMFNIKQPVGQAIRTKIQDFIQACLEELNVVSKLDRTTEFIVVSGTPTVLAQISLGLNWYNSSEIHNYVFTLSKFEDTLNTVLSSTIDELVCKYGINEARADVLSAGALILLEVLQKLDIMQFRVSTNGLRHGVILASL